MYMTDEHSTMDLRAVGARKPFAVFPGICRRLAMRASGVLLVVVALAACATAPAATDPVPGPAGLGGPVISTDYYELYAPADTDVAVAHEHAERAVAQWKKYYGALPARFAVVLAPSASAMHARVNSDREYFSARDMRYIPWVTREGFQQVMSGLSVAAEKQALSHEICHSLLNEYYRAQVGGERQPPVAAAVGLQAAGHQTSALPSWFHEMQATLCETPAERQLYRESFAARREQRIPLREFFTMDDHPIVSMLQHGTASLDQGERRLQVSGNAMARVRVFYQQVHSLGEFFVAHGGPAAIQRIGDGLIRQQGITEILRQLDLPGDPDVLERAWLEWLHQ
jgi:hypothetical protein